MANTGASMYLEASGHLGPAQRINLIRKHFRLPTRRLDRHSRRGQAMVEFTLIAPIVFFTMFGIFEFGLMMFDLGSVRFAAEEAAKVEAQAGNASTKCASLAGCAAIYSGSPGNPDCDADCQAIVAINNTAVGKTSLMRVDEIDVEQLSNDGQFQPLSPRKYNNYSLSGGACASPCTPSSNYPTAGRDTTLNPSSSGINGPPDYLAVTIKFTYQWLSGIFKQFPAPTFTNSYFVRLEPQKFP